jgi:tetratricopeptide (TPR) repeat protein
MRSIRRIVCLLFILLLAQAVRGQTDPPKGLINSLPRDKTPEQLLALLALNLGAAEFKNGTYDRAVHYFIESKRLDPDLLNARLYLAAAHASQYVPGNINEENVKHAEAAVQEFRATLQIAPENLTAIDSLGSILFQLACTPFDSTKLEESKFLFKKHIHIAPKDPEPYYWVGVIDWTDSSKANHLLRAQFNDQAKENVLKDTDPLPQDLRLQYSKEFGPAIDDGIDYMQQAMNLRPDYDDAMAYLNLLYRRKADTVENLAERTQFLKMADDLIDKVKEIKTKRASQPK